MQAERRKAITKSLIELVIVLGLTIYLVSSVLSRTIESPPLNYYLLPVMCVLCVIQLLRTIHEISYSPDSEKEGRTMLQGLISLFSVGTALFLLIITVVMGLIIIVMGGFLGR